MPTCIELAFFSLAQNEVHLKLNGEVVEPITCCDEAQMNQIGSIVLILNACFVI